MVLRLSTQAVLRQHCMSERPQRPQRAHVGGLQYSKRQCFLMLHLKKLLHSKMNITCNLKLKKQ